MKKIILRVRINTEIKNDLRKQLATALGSLRIDSCSDLFCWEGAFDDSGAVFMAFVTLSRERGR